ncbi:MAG: FTR1 family iron permease [Alphaproteobacteria bacterium]|nr:FTR1 family iron permease [Alphaproteobacteria bacterium]
MRARLLFAVLLPLFLAVPAGNAFADQAGLADIANTLVEQGDALAAAYEPADGLGTSDGFSDLYFDVFEAGGLEAAIGRREAGRKAEIESYFSRIISGSAKGAPEQEIAEGWRQLRQAMLEERAVFAAAPAASSWLSTGIQAFLLLLREGVEALLVVGALIAYVQRAGGGRAMPMLYGGIVAALVASLVTAAVVRASVVGLDGRALEAVEGITMLLAAAVLLYVGHWMLARREAERWQGYIRRKVDAAVETGSGFALAAAVFLAVYREGAETVLFYHALLADAQGTEGAAVLGFLAAAVVLAALFMAVRTLGLRLPLKPFFTLTAALLLGLAFIFVGKGIVELQVIRWLPTTAVQGMPQLPWIGVFPSVEGLAAQAAFVLIAGFGLLLPRPHGRQA